jgi:hypothetical protein
MYGDGSLKTPFLDWRAEGHHGLRAPPLFFPLPCVVISPLKLKLLQGLRMHLNNFDYA